MIHKPSVRARSLLLAVAMFLASLASLTRQVDAQEPCGVNCGAPVNETVRPPLKSFNSNDSQFSVKGVAVVLRQGRTATLRGHHVRIHSDQVILRCACRNL